VSLAKFVFHYPRASARGAFVVFFPWSGPAVPINRWAQRAQKDVASLPALKHGANESEHDLKGVGKVRERNCERQDLVWSVILFSALR